MITSVQAQHLLFFKLLLVLKAACKESFRCELPQLPYPECSPFPQAPRGDVAQEFGAPLPCPSPAVRIIRPPHGRSPLLLVAQLLLLASQLFPLPLDSLLFPPPFLLYVHPFPLQPLPLQAFSVQALPLEFQPLPLPLQPLPLIPLVNGCKALLPVSPLSLPNLKKILCFKLRLFSSSFTGSLFWVGFLVWFCLFF